MSILSIQSSVIFGHVGNAAATLPLQRLGFEVWPVPTVLFSNHPGHGDHTGRALPAPEVAALIRGVAARPAFAGCRAVLSGYLGRPDIGPVVIDAVDRAKRVNPASIYCCNPVMGDDSEGLYVDPGLVDFFRTVAVPRADIVVVNAFELGILAEHPIDRPQMVAAAARDFLDRGNLKVAVTSLPSEDDTRIGSALVTAESAWQVWTPRLALRAKGFGDLFTALLLGRVLREPDPATLLADTVAATYAVAEATAAVDSDEPCLVAALDVLAAPTRRFEPAPMG